MMFYFPWNLAKMKGTTIKPTCYSLVTHRSSLLAFCISERLTAGPGSFTAPGNFFSSGDWAAAVGGEGS